MMMNMKKIVPRFKILKINTVWIMTKRTAALNVSSEQWILEANVKLLVIFAKLGMNELVSVLHVIKVTRIVMVFARLLDPMPKIITVLNGTKMADVLLVHSELSGAKENVLLLMTNAKHGTTETQNAPHAIKDTDSEKENAKSAMNDQIYLWSYTLITSLKFINISKIKLK